MYCPCAWSWRRPPCLLNKWIGARATSQFNCCATSLSTRFHLRSIKKAKTPPPHDPRQERLLEAPSAHQTSSLSAMFEGAGLLLGAAGSSADLRRCLS